MVSQSATVELCPVCHNLVRHGNTLSFRDDDRIRLEDVAAIDTWVSGLNGIEAANWQDTVGRKQVRTIKASSRWNTVVVYDLERLGLVSVRMTVDCAECVVRAKTRDLWITAAEHAVQPFAEVGITTQWGVEQHLSTNTLCPELFVAVVKRLESAMLAAVPMLQ